MKGVYVMDFGVKDNVQTYRVNGDYADLERIIEACKKENAQFSVEPEIKRSHQHHFTMLLKLKVKIRALSNSET